MSDDHMTNNKVWPDKTDARDLIARLAHQVGDRQALSDAIYPLLDDRRGHLLLALALREMFSTHLTPDPDRPGTFRA